MTCEVFSGDRNILCKRETLRYLRYDERDQNINLKSKVISG